ncbi:amidase [Limnobacter humi]|uniref:Amidase n=1 Tax=Limnobacter humi TaxID=1778671 RepID=A0ABT1WFQ6_9BURK|nr:amidase [Limnobacter humi]MCQ8895881.1 amidase [Limnobacter humi]
MKKTIRKTVSAFGQDALGQFDATALAQQLQEGNTTSTALVQAALNRLMKVERDITATVCLQAEKALEKADALDRAGQFSGFAGLPTFLKDNIDLKGHPTRHGSLATTAERKTTNGAVAQQMENMGLVLLGKSKLPEFGFTATTEYSKGEPARNPWNTGFTTGGSSGGSAALVAAGVVPIAHANDGGGSIRIPAACCGLVGLKPSRGRWAPNEMAKNLPINIVSDGVVCRSVRDAAGFMALIDQHHPSKSLKPVGHIKGPAHQRLKIGYFVKKIDGQLSDPECVKAVEQAAQLCSELGHEVEQIEIPLSVQFADDFLLYWGMLAAATHRLGPMLMGRGFDREALEPLTYGLSGHFTRNILKFPFALHRLKRFAQEYDNAFNSVDVLLSPTLGQPPQALGHLGLDLPFDIARERLMNFASYTAAQNVAGAPAITLPMHHTRQNIPVGVHFAGAMGTEAMLLELAYEIEQAQPFRMLFAEEPGELSQTPARKAS